MFIAIAILNLKKIKKRDKKKNMMEKKKKNGIKEFGIFGLDILQHFLSL